MYIYVCYLFLRQNDHPILLFHHPIPVFMQVLYVSYFRVQSPIQMYYIFISIYYVCYQIKKCKNSKKKYLKSKWKQDFGGHFTKMAHITYLSKCECLYSFPIACLNETMINEVTVGCCFCVYCTQYNFVLDIINQGLYNYANHVFELFTVG